MERDLKFNKYLELENINQLKHLCIEKGVKKTFKKGEYIIRKGYSKNIFGFIETGGVKYMNYTTKGEMKTVGFSFANDFIADLPSFLEYYSDHLPDTIAVTDSQAITESVIYSVSYQDISEIENTLIKDISRTFLIDIYTRLLSMYCDTAEQRYLKLIKKHSDILNVATLRDIASFINVTPETLSRIRKKITFTNP